VLISTDTHLTFWVKFFAAPIAAPDLGKHLRESMHEGTIGYMATTAQDSNDRLIHTDYLQNGQPVYRVKFRLGGTRDGANRTETFMESTRSRTHS
jgi:hypothetical protein